MRPARQVRSSAEKLAARIADCGHTAPDSSSSRAALYTPHIEQREILYYDVVMLSAMLQCLAIWRIAEYCGAGVVLQGPGVGRRAGRVGAAQ